MRTLLKVGDRVKVVRCGIGVGERHMGTITTITEYKENGYEKQDGVRVSDTTLGNMKHINPSHHYYYIGVNTFELVNPEIVKDWKKRLGR